MANYCTRWRGSKNLRVSLFNDDLSNEPNFSRIHLAGQYLYNRKYKVDLAFSPLRFFSRTGTDAMTTLLVVLIHNLHESSTALKDGMMSRFYATDTV
jgi:hypothetical protein